MKHQVKFKCYFDSILKVPNFVTLSPSLSTLMAPLLRRTSRSSATPRSGTSATRSWPRTSGRSRARISVSITPLWGIQSSCQMCQSVRVMDLMAPLEGRMNRSFTLPRSIASATSSWTRISWISRVRISASITPLQGIQSSCLPAGGEEVTVSHEPTEDTVKSLRWQLAVETAAKDKIIEVLVCILFLWNLHGKRCWHPRAEGRVGDSQTPIFYLSDLEPRKHFEVE